MGFRRFLLRIKGLNLMRKISWPPEKKFLTRPVG